MAARRFARYGLVLLLTLLGVASRGYADGRILDVPYRYQGDTGWCWATTTAMVLNAYGIQISQCQIVSGWTHRANCGADPPDRQRGGPVTEMMATLRAYGVQSSLAQSPLSWDDIRNEIGQGWLMIAEMRNQDAGHVVVLNGYDDDGGYVYVRDPADRDVARVQYGDLLHYKDYTWQTTIHAIHPTGPPPAPPAETRRSEGQEQPPPPPPPPTRGIGQIDFQVSRPGPRGSEMLIIYTISRARGTYPVGRCVVTTPDGNRHGTSIAMSQVGEDTWRGVARFPSEFGEASVRDAGTYRVTCYWHIDGYGVDGDVAVANRSFAIRPPPSGRRR